MKPYNPSDELKSTQLWQYLNLIDSEFADRAVCFVVNIAPLLSKIKDFFPNYTRHDAHHSYNVVTRIGQILKEECLTKGHNLSLKRSEALILILSSYGHDLGMTILPGEEEYLRARFGIADAAMLNGNSDILNFLRQTHSKRGGQFINDNFESLGVPRSFIVTLNDMMESHNYSEIELEQRISRQAPLDGTTINLTQLSAILCLGDLLEYSDTRVVDDVLPKLKQALNIASNESLRFSFFENDKHDSIGSNVSIDNSGKLLMSGSFNNPDVLNVAYKTSDDIQKWLRVYVDIDLTSLNPKLRIRESISTDFRILGSDFERIGVRLNKDNIIRLVTSNSIWLNKPELVIKELLQNSVEACRYRRHNKIVSEDYFPQVSVIFSRIDKTIIIEDNGCGMTRNVILSNFLTVGNSRSLDSTYRINGFQSLARFGIGFWSVFTIAKNTKIFTSAFRQNSNSNISDGVSFNVSVDQLKDYVIFEPLQMKVGTQIILYLKEGIDLALLYDKISSQFGIMACSEIPLRIKLDDTDFFQLPKDPIIPSLQKILGAKFIVAEKRMFKEFRRKVVKDSMVIEVAILYIEFEGNISFDVLNYKSTSLVIELTGFEESSICGFKNAIFPISLQEIMGNSSLKYSANCSDPKGFEYELNRQALIKNEAYQEYADFISESCLKVFKEFLTENNLNDPKSIYRLYEEGCKGLTRSGNNSDNRNVLEQLIRLAPELYCYKLIPIGLKAGYVKEPIYKSLKQLLLNQFIIVDLIIPFNSHKRKILPEEFINKASLCKMILHGNSIVEEAFLNDRKTHLFFSYCSSGYVVTNKVAYNDDFFWITILVSNTKEVSPNNIRDWVMGTVSGKWSGIVMKRKIVGNLFAFGNFEFYVDPNSQLFKDFETLFSQGEHSKISSIINLLALALTGIVDDSVKEYI